MLIGKVNLKYGFVSLLTLAALMGTSENAFAMEDQGSPEQARKASPRQSTMGEEEKDSKQPVLNVNNDNNAKQEAPVVTTPEQQKLESQLTQDTYLLKRVRGQIQHIKSKNLPLNAKILEIESELAERILGNESALAKLKGSSETNHMANVDTVGKSVCIQSLPTSLIAKHIIPFLDPSDVVDVADTTRHLRKATTECQLWTRLLPELKSKKLKNLKGVSLLELEERNEEERYQSFISDWHKTLCEASTIFAEQQEEEPKGSKEEALSSVLGIDNLDLLKQVLPLVYNCQKRFTLDETNFRSLVGYFVMLGERRKDILNFALNHFEGEEADNFCFFLKHIVELGNDQENVCQAFSICKKAGIPLEEMDFPKLQALGSERVDICEAAVPLILNSRLFLRKKIMSEELLEVAKNVGKNRKAVIHAAVNHSLVTKEFMNKHENTLVELFTAIDGIENNRNYICSLVRGLISSEMDGECIAKIIGFVDELQVSGRKEEVCSLASQALGKRKRHDEDVTNLLKGFADLGWRRSEIWAKVADFISDETTPYDIHEILQFVKKLDAEFDGLSDLIKTYKLIRGSKDRLASGMLEEAVRGLLKYKPGEREAVCFAAKDLLIDSLTIYQVWEVLDAVHGLGKEAPSVIAAAPKIGLLNPNNLMYNLRYGLECVKALGENRSGVIDAVKEVIPEGTIENDESRVLLCGMLKDISTVDHLYETINLAKSYNLIRKGMTMDEISNVIDFLGRKDFEKRQKICEEAKKGITEASTAWDIIDIINKLG